MSKSLLSAASLLGAVPALAGLVLLASLPARAATDDAAGLPDRAQPMRIAVVRDASPGCTPTCAEWVAAQGKIVPETRDAFLQVLRSLGDRRLPVFIDSVGGSVPDAMAIGREIRARHLDVVVTRTALGCGGRGCAQAVSPGAVAGRAHGIGAVCASACTLVLAAGEKREAAPWTLVGVHQIVIRQTMTRVEKMYRVVSRMVGSTKVVVSRTLIGTKALSSYSVTHAPPLKAYDEVSAYLADMGIGAGLMPLMLATPPSGIHWMSAEEGRSTALVTDKVDGEYVTREAARTVLASRQGASATEAGSVPEEAVFVRATAGADKVQTSVGRVTWTLEPPRSDNPADVVLRAQVEVPDTGVHLDLRMTRDPERDASDAPVIDLAFATAPSGAVRTVDRIGVPQAGDLAQADARRPLAGTVQPKGGNDFLVRLSSDGALSRDNESMVRTQPWIGIPMLVDGDTKAILMVQHASAGEPLIDRAFRAWRAGARQADARGAAATLPRT